MENIINENNTQNFSARMFPGYKNRAESQYDGYQIRPNSNETRIIKRRKLKGKIRTVMNIIK
jgi:hypothetical protein